MSKVMKCDRCGGEYSPLSHGNDNRWDWREVEFWTPDEEYGPDAHMKSFHLCEVCSDDVVAFIEGREGR